MNPKIRPNHFTCATALLAAVIAIPAVGQVAPSASPAKSETAIVLSPFEIVAENDSYDATNTMGVTGTNREIRRLPLSMDAYTRTFIDEIGATDVTSVMLMAPNIEFRSDSGPGSAPNGVDQFRIRGLFSKEERRRNGFLHIARTDLFSTERVEILRGAQSLLYGQGISAGTVNTVTKRARPGNFLEGRIITDSDGTFRYQIDANASKGVLSARVAATAGDQRYWQDNLSDTSRGIYLDLAYKLSENFTLRGNFENFSENNRNRSDTSFILRDNSLKDSRNGQRTDLLLFRGNTAGIVVANGPLDWKNYRSLFGSGRIRLSDPKTFTLSLEGNITRKWAVRAAFNRQDIPLLNSTMSSNDLIAPTDSRAISNQWTVRMTPTRFINKFYTRTGQLNSVYEFDFPSWAKNQFVTGAEYRFKGQRFAQQRQYAVGPDGQYTIDPTWNPSITTRINLIPRPDFYFPIQSGYNNSDLSAPGYAWRDRMAPGLVPPTALNPLGFAGDNPLTIREEDQKAAYANLLSTWFDGKVELMAGTRWDKIKIDDRTTLLRLTDTTINTWIVGGVYNFTPAFGVYANTAKSLAGQGGFSPTPANEYLPPGIGRAREAGLKLDLWNRRVSGSLAYYENEAGSEAVNIPLPERNVVDAPGINARNGGQFLPIFVKSKGLEASLSFRLTPNWRMQLNAGTNNGRIIGDRELPIYYNDQFYSDGTTVRISSNSGPALMVPASPADPRGAQVPLTLAMLKDPGSPYFAKLDPTSGQITNASTLGLTTTGVGTGATGLPIGRHQLGFISPTNGRYKVFQGGDDTTPNSQRSASINTNYALTTTAFRGLSFGGTAQWRGNLRQGYITVANIRRLYLYPDSTRIDLRLGYERKFKRFRWTTQLMVQNVFGDQNYLEETTVTGAANDIEIRDIPRTFVWTNTFRF